MSASRAASPRHAKYHQHVDFQQHVDPRARHTGRATGGAGFTIAHAGRQIRLGPVAFWIAVGSVVIMAGWSLTTATYFAFRNDLLKGVMARQAEQQFAYEDRIAELRSRIDRTTSRQLLDQEQFEQKLDDLLHRQATLESRAAALNGIVDPASTGSIRPRPPQEPGAGAPGRDRQSLLDPEWMQTGRRSGRDADMTGKLARAETSLDRVERRQSQALAQIQERYEGKARRLRGVLADLGVKPNASMLSGTGGPFVPIKLPGEGNNGFERVLARVTMARALAEQLSRSLVWVPIRKPVTGELDVSSLFGVRADPFLHVAAMHTGIDFRGYTGDPIHATAAGVVTTAGWSGGYGKMVEIDHGNGLATRYGHMSKIDVSVGDRIRIGQVVGRMGSTGRSTGPHVHYETRVDGEAVDPQKFLNAGARLESGG
jgi:murein DD-endopeptidase MepM/ murein hydrolase activator NlpD